MRLLINLVPHTTKKQRSNSLQNSGGKTEDKFFSPSPPYSLSTNSLLPTAVAAQNGVGRVLYNVSSDLSFSSGNRYLHRRRRFHTLANSRSGSATWLTVRQKRRAGERKWYGPRLGLVLCLFFLYCMYFTLFLTTVVRRARQAVWSRPRRSWERKQCCMIGVLILGWTDCCARETCVCLSRQGLVSMGVWAPSARPPSSNTMVHATSPEKCLRCATEAGNDTKTARLPQHLQALPLCSNTHAEHSLPVLFGRGHGQAVRCQPTQREPHPRALNFF